MGEFVARPWLEMFHRCTKEQLIEIADHFGVVVSKLPLEPGTPSKDQKFMEMLRLRELDLEM